MHGMAPSTLTPLKQLFWYAFLKKPEMDLSGNVSVTLVLIMVYNSNYYLQKCIARLSFGYSHKKDQR